MNNLHFRLASLSDIDALVALVESAYRGDESRKGWTTEADYFPGIRTSRALLTEDLERENSEVIIAERDGDLVACSHIMKISDDSVYFGLFAVRPEGQAQGVGKAMLAEAERRSVELWHASQLEMTVVHLRTELLAYYGRRGYSETGVVHDFPPHDERYGLPPAQELKLVVLAKSLLSHSSLTGHDENTPSIQTEASAAGPSAVESSV
jgi:GNAT superfamily N-acetyltransferase